MKKTNTPPTLASQAGSGAGTNDIRSIKAPVHIPGPWTWLWWALGSVVVAVLAVLLWRRLRTLPSAAMPVLVIPPHHRAREKLKAALELINQPKPFIVAVSDTIRLYLEERFDFRAPERTTEEFLIELQSSHWLTAPQKDSLAEFLQRCDLVKFARYEPRTPELQDIFQAAIRLVDDTAPQQAAPVDAGEPAKA
jgi:hypothetical protein